MFCTILLILNQGLRHFKKVGTAEKGSIDFEMGDQALLHNCIRGGIWFDTESACFLLCFWWQKQNVLKSSLGLYFHTLVVEFFWFTKLQFKTERKIHAKAITNAFRDAGWVSLESFSALGGRSKWFTWGGWG